MLSGIGPADHLAQVGIDVKHDLPGVGSTLSDHLRTGVGVLSPEGVGQNADPLPKWRRTGYGPLAVAQNTSVAFVRSGPGTSVADIELMFELNTAVAFGSLPPERNGYHIDVGLIQPKSKGTIRVVDPTPRVRGAEGPEDRRRLRGAEPRPRSHNGLHDPGCRARSCLHRTDAPLVVS